MKFRDGYWDLRDGLSLLNRVDVRDVEATDSELIVFSSTRKVLGRGDTLNTALLTTTFSSPMPGVIHVGTYRHKGSPNPGPMFALAPDGAEGVRIEETDDSMVFGAGDLIANVQKAGDWRATFSYLGQHLTEISGRHSGHVTTGDGNVYMSEHLTLSVGECVYGLGERFTPFVKNGQVVDIWNEDGGTSSELAYKNIPFYLTSRGYGVLVADAGKVSFEVGSEVVSSVQFSVPGEFLDYYIIGGESPREVLRNYSALTGAPALPPPWSFGLWLSTSFTTSYDEATVTGFVDGMAERDIPLHVFHFDCYWMKEFQWVDLEWDPDQFADPEAMLGRLKSRGLRICVWINPYIAQKSRLFDEGMEGGYLVRKPDGSVWQWDRWQAGMALVDFTNPDAVAWYRGALKKLLDMGVDTFKTDFGERIPTDVVYSDGSDPVRMHNYYTSLYNQCVFGLLEEVRGKNEAVVFARSATVGGQRFPVHWGGDCSANYESMAESLRGGLSLGISGFGFWSHDIGGFEHTAPADLFKRWIAFGALSSHSRLHGNQSYRVPWLFDDEASDVMRLFVKLKCSLMPYIFAQASVTHETGVPMLRAMALEFPGDPACAYLDRQYMFGESLMVAPIFSDDGNVSYYLPHGSWTRFLTGERVEGGSWRTEQHGYESLPLMVRQDSIIAMGPETNRPDYDFAQDVSFHLFELTDSSSSSATVRDHDGTVVMEIRISREGRQFVIEKSGVEKPWSVCLRGITSATVSEGHAEMEDTPAGPLVIPAAKTSRIVVTVGE